MVCEFKAMRCKSSRQAQPGGCLQKEHKTVPEKQLQSAKVTSNFATQCLAWTCASTVCAAKKLHLK